MMDVLWNILVTYVIVMTLNTGQTYLMSQTNITEEGILREGKTLVEDFFSRYNTTEEVDLVFILDRSASVPPNGWQSIVNFVKTLLQQFTIDATNTRVAIITFSTQGSVDINDLESERENKCTLNRRIHTVIERKRTAGFTATYNALEKAKYILLNSRAGAKKAVFVLTDGKSNIGPPPVRASFEIRSLRWQEDWRTGRYGPQIEVYAFGIDSAYMPELRSIASPIPHHIFKIPNFTLFDHLARSLHGDKQEQSWHISDRSRCMPSCSEHAQCTCGTMIGEYRCVCKPGYEGNGETCTACVKGFYKEDLAPSKCVSCKENTTTLTEGATRALECFCREGYHRDDNNNGSCVLLLCDELPVVQHATCFHVRGKVLDEVAPTSVACRNTVGDSCHYQCHHGYRLSGLPALYCAGSGKWEGEAPTCKLIECGRLEDIDQGTEHGIITYHNGTVFGSVVSVSCEAGYRPFGDTVRQCDVHGVWRGTRTHCVEILCPQRSAIVDGEISPASCLEHKQSLGVECHMTCRPGYSLDGIEEDTVTCQENSQWTNKDATPYCKDVEPPTIKCPPAMEYEAPKGQNHSIIHWDQFKPEIADNSGSVSYTVFGGKSSKQFSVGHHYLEYVAEDEAGNSAKCFQALQVLSKQAVIVSCPRNISYSDVTSTTLSVTWPEPVFRDGAGRLLPYVCTRMNASEFTIGLHNVHCYPKEHFDVACLFSVNIKGKTCEMPRTPHQGSRSCSRTPLHLQYCTVQCNDRYDFAWRPSHFYWCDNNGVWGSTNRDMPWPDCSRRHRAGRAVMQGQFHLFYYRGSCDSSRDDIKTAFHTRLNTLTESACVSSNINCDVSDVQVHCGIRSRRKRDTAEEDTPQMVEISFSVEGQIMKNETDISDRDQGDLTYALGDIEYIMGGQIMDGEFNVTLPDGELTAVQTPMNYSVEFLLNCTAGQVVQKDDYSAQCVNCPIGTAWSSVNGSCELCPVGGYQSLEAQAHCEACPDGLSTAQPGATNYTQCLAPCSLGQSSASGLEPCDPCDLGFYANSTGSIRCTRCPPGMLTYYTGATHYSNCTARCEAGHYNRESGLEPCTACPLHTYQDRQGAQACVPCPGDMETTHTAATNSQHCQAVDHCENNTECRHNATCQSRAGGFDCQCSAGYTGEFCQLPVDECLSSPCSHGATCSDQLNAYTCLCPPGYTGLHCENEINECDSSPCANQASCLDLIGGYQCFCIDGYNGTNCETNIDDCQSSPCVHGNCTDQANAYHCDCEYGYTGWSCEFLMDNCVSEPCVNGGTCRTVPDGFSCHCQRGFTGSLCETDIDECLSSPCSGGATCRDLPGGFKCRCPPGYHGQMCKTYTSPDFDLIFPAEGATSYVMLRDVPTLHVLTTCLWLKTTDNKNYGTIVSYAVDNNWLAADASNTFTLYDYGRLQVYVNGEFIRTNISLNSGAWQHLCVTWETSGGSWRVYVNGSTAARGHDLASGSYIPGGGYLVIGQEQDSFGGGFSPREAFVGTISQLNIWDTVLHEDTIRSLSNVTQPSSPSLSPQCNTTMGNVVAWPDTQFGTRGNAEIRHGSWCMDIDECLYPDLFTCNRNEACANLKGSYMCELCPEGYSGPHCKDINDPCMLNPCSGSATCQHLQELDDFVCHCPQGFIGRLCDEPIDHCLSQPCLNNGTCANLLQGFKCTCPQPDMGPNCGATSGSCHPSTCMNGGSCVHMADDYKCACASGFSGQHCEYVLDVCGRTPCANNGTCVPSEGGYHCLCPPAWRGPHCSISYTPSCGLSPCLNDGTCVDSRASPTGYRCICHSNITDGWGPNCELASACDSNPCLNRGICVAINTHEFSCICPMKFSGPRCEYPVTTAGLTTATSSKATPSSTHTKGRKTTTFTKITRPPTSSSTRGSTAGDLCGNVECFNGGTCIMEGPGFTCKCTRYYTGRYCGQKKQIIETTYHVILTLDEEYKPSLEKSPVFRNQFSAQIHKIYLDANIKSKLEVVINSVRQGSVVVDFDLRHTVYMPGDSLHGVDAMRAILWRHLEDGRLGQYRANTDNFHFRRKDVSSVVQAASLETVYIAIGAIGTFILLVVAILLIVILCRKRREKMHPDIALNNRPPVVFNPICNPVYDEQNESDGRPCGRSPRLSAEENIYAELNDLQPYAMTTKAELDATLKSKKCNLRVKLPPEQPERAPMALPRSPPAYLPMIPDSDYMKPISLPAVNLNTENTRNESMEMTRRGKFNPAYVPEEVNDPLLKTSPSPDCEYLEPRTLIPDSPSAEEEHGEPPQRKLPPLPDSVVYENQSAE